MDKYADLVLFSKNIYTVNKDENYDGGVAVSGNTILKVGSRAEIETLINTSTQIYDMGEKLIMPGFIDSHTHIEGPLSMKKRANLYNIKSKEECVKVMKEWADSHPDDEWVGGVGWNLGNWEDRTLPTKELLDAIIPDRPVFLQDQDYHNGWFNSKALELIGVNKDTPEGESSGFIQKDESGEPTGYIQDGYVFHAYHLAVSKPIEENPDKYLPESLNLHNELGITSINEMYNRKNGDPIVDYWSQLEQNNKLNLRIFFHYCPFENSIETLKQDREQYQSEKLRLNGTKIFMDGVWSTHSAAMLTPYADMPDFAGELYHTPEELRDKIMSTDKEGFYTRIHCSGDRAVRVSLDAYEAAIKENPLWNRRHSVEHNDLVHADDISRFAKLGVIANVTPWFIMPTVKWENNPLHYVYNEEQLSELWRFKSLLDSGATVTYGADCIGESLNPLEQIYRGLTRIALDGKPQGGFMMEEKISVKEGIRCYTINGAYELGMEDRLGTLEAGKLADIIVLDRNIMDIPAEDLLNTKVVLTLVDGKVVYENQ